MESLRKGDLLRLKLFLYTADTKFEIGSLRDC